jgi:hypothetical protein
MLTGNCHCGAASVTIPRQPRSVTDCNCSICRRYGVLWAYFRADQVKLTARPKALHRYSCNEKSLHFVRCAGCGCVMVWQPTKPAAAKWHAKGRTIRNGVNIRMFDPKVLLGAKVEFLDGAAW